MPQGIKELVLFISLRCQTAKVNQRKKKLSELSVSHHFTVATVATR